MTEEFPDWVAYHPELLPPLSRMADEGINVLEEWFRWGEQWGMLLRIYGKLSRGSRVLEIGCGQGRVAFPLRFYLSSKAAYTGFDIDRRKIEFLERTFQSAYQNFRFVLANLHNSFYNPAGATPPTAYRFPAEDRSQNLVFAASVFTHMLPENLAHYLHESRRVLAPDGRCVFSFFLLDHYIPGVKRPYSFGSSRFAFDHPFGDHGDDFAVADPDDPEKMTGYRTAFVERLAADAGLRLVGDPLPGLWSGAFDNGILAQDLMVLSPEAG